MMSIDEGFTDEDVAAYVAEQLVSYEFVEDLKQYILEQSIDGGDFLALTDEELKENGLRACKRKRCWIW